MAPVVLGVLALQGAFIEHVEKFRQLGVTCIEIRSPGDFEHVDALIIPGGESTTLTIAAERLGLWKELQDWVSLGKPTWGTCAGLILLSKDIGYVKSNGQSRLGVLDISVDRNYFGSQINSFAHPIQPSESWKEMFAKANELVPTCTHNAAFIRAPMITRFNDDNIELLATLKCDAVPEKLWTLDPAVAVRKSFFMGTTFHPELTDCYCWHKYFLLMTNEFKRNTCSM
jgi:pyridoxal 5'-phosphate synthase pdxT subunit